jgi:CHAD domain-containing protein
VPPAADAAAAACRDVVPPLLAEAWRRLARAAGRLEPDEPDERWHRARIRAKRARYAAEAAVPVLGPAAARPAKAAAALQELLGEHQDAALAADRVLGLAVATPGDPDLLVTARRLAERERAAIRQARARFPAVWAAATRRKVTKSLPG